MPLLRRGPGDGVPDRPSAAVGTDELPFGVRGTPEATWEDAGRLTDLPTLDVADVFPDPAGTLWVVAPHPDDETFGVGGIIALASEADVDVRVVAVTDGEGTAGDRVLAATRRREQEKALAHLAPGAEIIRLLLPDAGVKSETDLLGRHLRDLFGPLDVVLATWEGDGHGDHEAVGATVLAVARRTRSRVLQYPIWTWHWATPGDARVPWSRMHRVPLGDAAAHCKKLAVREHASQTSGAAPVVPPDVVQHLTRTYETLIL